MPKHRCAAGLSSSNPLFPSCLRSLLGDPGAKLFSLENGNTHTRLECPIGKPLYETLDWIVVWFITRLYRAGWKQLVHWNQAGGGLFNYLLSSTAPGPGALAHYFKLQVPHGFSQGVPSGSRGACWFHSKPESEDRSKDDSSGPTVN